MRRTAALLALTFAAGASGQAKPPAPTTVAQVQPINRILSGVRQVVTRFGGADAAAGFDKGLADKLGEKGLSGLDLERPITAYHVVKDTPKQQSWVILVPVTDKAEVLDLLKRVKAAPEPTAGDADLVKLTVESDQAPELLVRFKGGVAYVGVNVEPADLDPKLLPSAADLTLPNEGAWLATTTHIDRITPADRKKLEAAALQASEQFAAIPLPPAVRDRVADAMKVSQRYGSMQYDLAKTIVQRIDFDPKTAEFKLDYLVTPKAGSTLATGLASRRATDNRFGAALGSDTVAGFVTKLPLFIPELRDGTADLLQLAQDDGLGSVPEQYQPAAKEALAGLARAAKSGRVDLAAAVRGPDSSGVYTASAAVSFDDASKLDAELRKLRAGLDPNLRSLIKLDVYKADGVVVHEVNAAAGVSATQRKLWGEEPTLCVAFTKTGVLATFGPNALERIKELVKAAETPRPAAVLDFQLNPKRARDFGLLLEDDGIGKLIPRDAKDELRSLVKLSVAGGDTLAVRMLMDLGMIPNPKAQE